MSLIRTLLFEQSLPIRSLPAMTRVTISHRTGLF